MPIQTIFLTRPEDLSIRSDNLGAWFSVAIEAFISSALLAPAATPYSFVSTARPASCLPEAIKKRGLSGIKNNAIKNNDAGNSSIQNIQRQASNPSHNSAVESPAKSANK